MFFLPLRVDLDLRRLPLLTLGICIVCILIFLQQQSSFEQLRDAIIDYCGQQADDRGFAIVVEKVFGEPGLNACAYVIQDIRNSPEAEREIVFLAEQAGRIESFPADYSRQFIETVLREKYAAFMAVHPQPDLTSRLMYWPDTFALDRMLTAVFAHGDWLHLVGNLIFFYAFAASVEVALGFGAYILMFLVLAFGSQLVYSLAMLRVVDALPTIGLSGVVMGMIGLFAYLMPTVRIQCFLWFLIIVRIVRVPAWILAAWYIGWDIFNLNNSDQQSNINFVAHIGGALIGFVCGLLLFRARKAEIGAELQAQRGR